MLGDGIPHQVCFRSAISIGFILPYEIIIVVPIISIVQVCSLTLGILFVKPELMSEIFCFRNLRFGIGFLVDYGSREQYNQLPGIWHLFHSRVEM